MLARVPQLPLSETHASNVVMDQVGSSPEKPPLAEVLAYATAQVKKYVRDHASHLPPEQQEEISQEALIRVANAYADLDPTRGWKSFVQTHCNGAVLDYLRDGTGFKESRWDDTPKDDDSEENAECPESSEDATGSESAADDSSGASSPQTKRKFKQRLNQRVSIVSTDDDQPLDVEAIAGIFGVHSQVGDSGNSKIRWNLVARMASVDREIHLVAKLIRGFTETELAPGFGVTREMLSQRFYAFIEKLDSPEFYHSPWIAQTIYAFGLSEEYGMPENDNGLGWDKEPIDLDSRESLALMSLFQQQEFQF